MRSGIDDDSYKTCQIKRGYDPLNTFILLKCEQTGGLYPAYNIDDINNEFVYFIIDHDTLLLYFSNSHIRNDSIFPYFDDHQTYQIVSCTINEF